MNRAALQRKSSPGRGATTAEPEAGASLVFWRNGKEAIMNGEEREREEVRRGQRVEGAARIF